MKYRFAAIAVLGMLIMTGCGHDQLSENAPEAAEVSATEDISDDSANETSENDDISIDVDVSEIPDGAAYKCTKYMVYSGESTVMHITYCDEYGNDIRDISYMDDEPISVLDMENEYNSDGQLVRMKANAEISEEYSDGGDSVAELEYNENGCIKKLTTCYPDDLNTITNYEYEYDDLGRPITVMEYWDGDNELFSTTYKTYDENGNVSKEKSNLKGKLESETFYQYDEKGRVVRKENSMSKSSFYWEYEYEDYKDFTITRPFGLVY